MKIPFFLQVIIAAFILVVAGFIFVFFSWSKSSTAPYGLFAWRCQIAGGKIQERSYGMAPREFQGRFYHVCISTKSFSDVGKKCEVSSDCEGICESVEDDVLEPKACTNLLKY